MQHQRNKLDQEKKKHRKTHCTEYEISDKGEMYYMEPTCNQYIKQNGKEDQIINEDQTAQMNLSLQDIIFQIKDGPKNRMNLTQIKKEFEIKSLKVNIPRLETKTKNLKTIFIGETKEDREYNIKLNKRKYHDKERIKIRQNMNSFDNLFGIYTPYEQHFQESLDHRKQKQYSFNPKDNIILP